MPVASREGPVKLDSTTDAQLADLLQNLFDTSIEVALRILLPRLSIEVLLNLGHAAVSLGTEAQLDLDESLERGIEIGYTQVNELRQLGAELFVELLISGLGHVLLLLGTRELSHILVGFVNETLDFGA